MPIIVACKCGQRLRANDEHAGKQSKCPKCGQIMTLSGPQVPPFDVFVSYSSKDKTTADALCATFESKQLRCWIAPRDILPGANWGEAIIEGIEQSRAMVLVFSAHANESPQVKREVERAVGKGIPVIPLRIEDVKPSRAMEYFISSQHWLDALTPPLEKHLQELARTVARLLGDAGSAGRQPEASKPAPVAPVVAPRRGRMPRWAWIAAAASILLLLACIGMYVVTDYGTIRIELSNATADVDVQVDDGIRRASDPIRLRAGEHGLLVAGKDYETVSRSFFVKRGDNEPLKVTLVPKAFREVLRFDRHSDFVLSVAFSPDGKYALSGANNGEIFLWDVRTGNLETGFKGHTDAVVRVMFSADGLQALSCSGGKYGQDQNSFGSAADRTLRLWEVPGGREIHSFTHPELVRACAFSADGRHAVSGGLDGMVRVWDLQGKKTIAEIGIGNDIHGAVSAPNSGDFYVGSQTVHRFNFSKNQELSQFKSKAKEWIAGMAVTSDGRRLFAGNNQGWLECWDTVAGEALWRIPAHADTWIRCVALTSDERHLLTAGYDKTVRMWDLQTRQEIGSFTGHTQPVASVAISPDGGSAISAGFDKTVRVWRLPHTNAHRVK